jgi:phosphohistidine phosphatase SixA
VESIDHNVPQNEDSRDNEHSPVHPNPRISTTTTPRRKLRRRFDGSPILVLNPNLPSKRIFLIRHGESIAQAAAKSKCGWDPKTDRRLIDCGLTSKGATQAQQGIRTLLSSQDLASIELVVSSPLTRALHTALLAFPDKNILVGYDLREIGSKVPENTPRKMEDVLKDSTALLMDRERSNNINCDSGRTMYGQKKMKRWHDKLFTAI